MKRRETGGNRRAFQILRISGILVRHAVLFILLVAVQTCRADYVLKWTLPVYVNPFNGVLNDSRVDYPGTAVLDVNADGVEDFILLEASGGGSDLVLNSGATDQPIWYIPRPPEGHAEDRMGSSDLSTVFNLDGDGDTELVICFRRSSESDSGRRVQFFSCLRIYDCANHALEFSVPETSVCYHSQAGPCPDLDGDGLPEVAWYTSSDTEDFYAGTGDCRIYGWRKPGSTEFSPLGAPHIPAGFPLGYSTPPPDR
jgi:hypothetical protein